MAYTALKQMKSIHQESYGLPFPADPPDIRKKRRISSLERSALTFLRESCEGLNFDPERTDLTDRDGRSAAPGQIPRNMEKDVERLCLENAVHRFMRSGRAQDAFDVYFCYMEMFLGAYGTSRGMVELLSESESNASVLLMKHRDHYSHSVYVFLIGLALYQESPLVRDTYRSFYGLEEERAAACHFLRYWGLASLFHDIGYPFELAFEQVKSYFGDSTRGVPFVSYKGIEDYIRLSQEEQRELGQALRGSLGGRPVGDTLHMLFAGGIAARLQEAYGKDQEYICGELLDRLADSPENFNGFMDHAYFSGVLLFRQLMEIKGAAGITAEDLDAVTAILLHNSLYKFSITNVRDPLVNRPLKMELHPLAYLLMLSDELQCWDRISYGRNSRAELHAMSCDVKIRQERIFAVYSYDRQQEYKKDFAKGTYRKMEGEHCPFIRDIEQILEINREGTLQLELKTEFADYRRPEAEYLSSSSFLHLYHFAAALNGRYLYGDCEGVSTEQMEEDFEKLSLEYKLSNIQQAKAFSAYLDRIGCFYTDRAVDYELLESFTASQMDVIGPLEHERWRKEKLSMGWSLDASYADPAWLERQGVEAKERKAFSRGLRELTRTHTLMVEDYEELDDAEQDKDTAPMNCMLRLLRSCDGVRIYRL